MDAITEANEIIKNLALEYGLVFNDAFADVSEKNEYPVYDGVHSHNKKNNKIIENVIFAIDEKFK